MSPDYDTSDPLGLLMSEWAQLQTWFWIFVAATALVAALLPTYVLPMAVVTLGQPLLKLGQAVVICTNELRKGMGSAATRREEA